MANGDQIAKNKFIRFNANWLEVTHGSFSDSFFPYEHIYSFRFPLQIDHLSTEQQKSEIFHSTTPKSYAGLERIKASFHLCAG